MLMSATLFRHFRLHKIITNKGRAYSWPASGVNGYLLDVYGVLYDGSSEIPITGSVQAVKK